MALPSIYQRCLPVLGYHHVLMGIIAASIALSSILVSGCSEDHAVTHDVYLLAISYINSSTTQGFDLRVGYFGSCAQNLGTSVWNCDRKTKNLGLGPQTDPLELHRTAQRFQDEVVFPGLLIAAIILAFLAFLGLWTFPGWHEEEDADGSIREVKPFPSRAVAQLVFAALLISGLLQVLCSVWQHVAATAAASVGRALKDQGANFHIGTTSMALSWVPTFLILISAVGLRILLDSILVLEETFEKHDDDEMYIMLRSRE